MLSPYYSHQNCYLLVYLTAPIPYLISTNMYESYPIISFLFFSFFQRVASVGTSIHICFMPRHENALILTTPGILLTRMPGRMPGVLPGILAGLLATPGSIIHAPECVIHIPEHVRREHICVPYPQHPRFSVSKQNNKNTKYIPFCFNL